MKTARAVEHDERTEAVTNAIYRRGYFFLTMALYVDVMVRVFARHEAPWDLLALVIGTGLVCTIYQARQEALPRKAVLIGAVFGVIFGVVFAVVLAVTRAM